MKKTNIEGIFPEENVSLLPLTFYFGETISLEDEGPSTGTRFSGEESISHPKDGGYDTD